MTTSRADPVGGEPAAGAVTLRWDLDKTYLRTEFESLRKMVRIPFEGGDDKVSFPGVPQLIQGVRRTCEASRTPCFVFFLSASPPQIGDAIRDKLALDGVEYDGIVFKDQLRNLMRGKWRNVREQVGYKLGELLAARMAGPAADREILFGDDWESDPLIYSLYADVVAGRLGPERLDEVLGRLGVDPEARRRIVGLGDAFADSSGEARDPVERIFIHLERRSPPRRFHRFGPRLVPTFNALQPAVVAYESGVLAGDGLCEVARALVRDGGFSAAGLRNSLDDLVRRGHLDPETRVAALDVLIAAGLSELAPEESRLRQRLSAAFRKLTEAWRRTDEEPAPALDYDEIVSAWVEPEDS